MNFSKTISTATPRGDSGIFEINVFLKLFQYFIAAVLGVIGGGIGVALMLGLLLVFQLAGSAGQTFAPEIVWMAILTSGLGVGIAWLLTGAVRRLKSVSTFQQLDRTCLQVTLVFSVLSALLEIFSYLHNVFI